jgi:hypothetical protein
MKFVVRRVRRSSWHTHALEPQRKGAVRASHRRYGAAAGRHLHTKQRFYELSWCALERSSQKLLVRESGWRVVRHLLLFYSAGGAGRTRVARE